MRILWAILAVVSLAAHVSADADMLDTTYVMDPVLVTSTHIETEARNLPKAVTVVTGDEMRIKGATSVIDGIVGSAPGLSVTQRSVVGFGLGSSSTGKVNIRGVGGNPNAQVLFLVDGRPDFVGLFSHPVPDAYALSQVDRVEIVRGPSSAVYGTNAMGGVVNIISKRKHTAGHGISINTMAGPWSTYDGDVTLMGMLGNGIDYRLTGGHTHTDGHTDNSDFTRTHVSGALGWRNGPWDFALRGGVTPFDGSCAGEIKEFDILRSNASLSAAYSEGALNSRITLHSNWGHHEFSDGWDSDDYTLGATAYTAYNLNNLFTTTVGLDFKRYGGSATNGSSDYGDPVVTEFAPSIGVQVPIAGYAMLNGSFLAQYHNQYGWYMCPEGGVSVHPLPRLTLKGSVSRGFRSPDMRAMYLFQYQPGVGLIPPDEKDYRDLEPEETLNTEVGVSYRFSHWLSADVSLFRTTGDNLLIGSPLQNAGEFTHKGIEIQSRFSFPRVTGRAFATIMDVGDNKAGNEEFSAGLVSTVLIERFAVSVDARHVRDRYDYASVTGTDVEMPDYTLLNLSISRPIWAGIRGSVMFKNILDENYATEYEQWSEGYGANATTYDHYYTMPGFHVLVGLSVDIGSVE